MRSKLCVWTTFLVTKLIFESNPFWYGLRLNIEIHPFIDCRHSHDFLDSGAPCRFALCRVEPLQNCFFTLWEKHWKFFSAVLLLSKACRRSSAISRLSLAVKASHEPSALAASIFSNPAPVIAPISIIFSIRSLFSLDQTLFGLRGVKSNLVRSSSSLRGKLSIQPKHKDSSTASSYETLGLPVCFLK